MDQRLPYTLSTRPAPAQDAQINAVLDAELALMTSALGMALKGLRAGEGESTLKTRIATALNLHNHQAGYAITRAKGMIESRLSNLKNNYLPDAQTALIRCQTKAPRLLATARRWRKRLKAASPDHPHYNHIRLHCRKSCQRVVANHRRQQRLQRLIQRYEAELASKNPSICIGSKTMLRQQYQLKENGYRSREHWLRDWRWSRLCGHQYVGSSDENGGGRIAKWAFADDGSLILRLSLSPASRERFGLNHLEITGLTFGREQAERLLPMIRQRLEARTERRASWAEYQRQYQDQFDAWKARAAELKAQIKALAESIKTAKKAKQTDQIKHLIAQRDILNAELNAVPVHSINQYLSGLGIALSTRFNRDRKGWRITLTCLLPRASDTQPVRDQGQGMIGVDLNVDHLAYTEIDANGDALDSGTLSLINPATGQVDDDHIWIAARKLSELAQARCKPVALESLDFSRRKRELESVRHNHRANTGYNRMLTQFAYGRAHAALVRRCTEAGITVRLVNPAYTSLIGLLSHRDRFDSVHLAASFIIARRALSDELANTDQQITLTKSLKGDQLDAIIASSAEDKAPADALELRRVRARLSEARKQQWQDRKKAIKRWRTSCLASTRRRNGELLTQLAI
jgi:IS605 OrfB family transposase